MLLGAGLAADLLLHDATHQALLAELPPRAAALVAEQAVRETANPWHRVLVIGEALLVLGLGGLYLRERGRRLRAERNG